MKRRGENQDPLIRRSGSQCFGGFISPNQIALSSTRICVDCTPDRVGHWRKIVLQRLSAALTRYLL